MGMTDKQFEAYQQMLLLQLLRIRKDLSAVASGAKIEELDTLIKNIESHLSRP